LLNKLKMVFFKKGKSYVDVGKTMKKLLSFLLLVLIIAGCSEGEKTTLGQSFNGEFEIEDSQSAETEIFTNTESVKNIAVPVETIEFYGEVFLLSQASDILWREDGTPETVFYEGFAYIGIAEDAPSYNSVTTPDLFDFENKYFTLPDKEYEIYEKVIIGQEIGGVTINEASAGFDFINGEWELSNSMVSLSGAVEYKGFLRKAPEAEFEMLPPGTLTFQAVEAINEPLLFSYQDYSYYVKWSEDYAEAMPSSSFILSGYNPENDYPDLFSDSDTIYVKAVLDGLWLRKTNRATGGNYSELVSIDLSVE